MSFIFSSHITRPFLDFSLFFQRKRKSNPSSPISSFYFLSVLFSSTFIYPLFSSSILSVFFLLLSFFPTYSSLFLLIRLLYSSISLSLSLLFRLSRSHPFLFNTPLPRHSYCSTYPSYPIFSPFHPPLPSLSTPTPPKPLFTPTPNFPSQHPRLLIST